MQNFVNEDLSEETDSEYIVPLSMSDISARFLVYENIAYTSSVEVVLVHFVSNYFFNESQ